LWVWLAVLVLGCTHLTTDITTRDSARDGCRRVAIAFTELVTDNAAEYRASDCASLTVIHGHTTAATSQEGSRHCDCAQGYNYSFHLDSSLKQAVFMCWHLPSFYCWRQI
jgi:hypothetical protein